MEQETTAAMAVSLPEDLLLEILVRIKDEPSLFRCATVCKRWRHLITDPSFLQCRWPDHDYSSSLVGFFTWDGEDVYKSCFVPTQRSPLGPGLRTLSSFVTAAPAGLFNGAVPLVSRHGLLLVRLEALLPTQTGWPDWRILQLAVCNMLVGTYHVLPALKFAMDINDKDDYELSAFAILTGADCCSKDESSSPSNSSFFKVVILTLDYDARKYSIHIFSSDEERWSVRTNCFDDTSEREDYGQFGDAVICHSTAHWLFCYCGENFHVISVNARTGNISKMKLHFLTVYFHRSDIFLTLGANRKLEIWMQTGRQLDIWEQQEDQQNVGVKHSQWVCTRTMEPNKLGEESHGRKLWVFGEKCGTLLVNEGQHLYTADLETRRMMEVSNWPGKLYISRWDVLPLEMDWPSIFISQLKI